VVFRLRDLTSEEREAIVRLAHSRSAPLRLVERARMISLAMQGKPMVEIATQLKVNRKTVRQWLDRFAKAGVAGLKDQKRSGRPRANSPDELREIAIAALTSPVALGLEFDHWTTSRLAEYLTRDKGIAMSAKRIGRLLSATGIQLRARRN